MSDIINPKEPNLVDYRETLKEFLRVKSNLTIPNGSKEHAIITAALFLDDAQEYMDILCDKLSSDVYENPEVLYSLEGALNRNIKIQVIFQEAQPESLKFISLLKKYGNGKIYKTAKDSEFNFFIIDDHAIRYEEFKGERKAVVNCNFIRTKEYSKWFDKVIKGHCKEYI
jgi:hypothetical protein